MTGTKSRPNARAAARMPRPASPRPAARAAATARWVGSSLGIAVHVGGGDAEPGQFMVEQHPGARSALPVDITHPGLGQVAHAAQPQRVAGRDDQPLVPVHQPHHGDLRVTEDPPDVGHRVFAGGRIEQV